MVRDELVDVLSACWKARDRVLIASSGCSDVEYDVGIMPIAYRTVYLHWNCFLFFWFENMQAFGTYEYVIPAVSRLSWHIWTRDQTCLYERRVYLCVWSWIWVAKWAQLMIVWSPSLLHSRLTLSVSMLGHRGDSCRSCCARLSAR